MFCIFLAHGESPCAEGRLVYQVLSPTITWIENVRAQ